MTDPRNAAVSAAGSEASRLTGGETPPGQPAETPALRNYLTRDHDRLDALLDAALGGDKVAYAEFRRGLLRHIGIEERILFPLLRSPLTETLHRDHAALAALLVPPPTRAEIEQIRTILAEHNPLEEGAGGLYEQVEALVDLETVKAFPDIRTAPYTDSPLLRQTIEQLLRERR